MTHNNTYQLGIDIGSTTMKMVVLHNGTLIYSDYQRHNANIDKAIADAFNKLQQQLGNCELQMVITGSVGMGYAKALNIHFVQEVVAAAEYTKHTYPNVKSLIDIGGEDSKMIFFADNRVPDIRMNGSCAGGTGAFIDQTATLLNVTTTELNTLAQASTTIYPIASRCGVFSKTDIQNLMARNVSKADIAASVFNAVAMQVQASLMRGTAIEPDTLFCGGPFAFLPELKKHFERVFNLNTAQSILPQHAMLIPAHGCAIVAQHNDSATNLSNFIQQLPKTLEHKPTIANALPPLFDSDDDYQQWLTAKTTYNTPKANIIEDEHRHYFLGVDSGSTTTKLVITNEYNDIVYTDYRKNGGDSFGTFYTMLKDFCATVEHPERIFIAGSTATGYGENLLCTAFGIQHNIVETIAHFTAAKKLQPEVSFILDIGGQDMKAIFVNNGTIQRIEINEACSSGCGSFIETYAHSLGYQVSDFAKLACTAPHPYDLGTRCTIFMNSKVKQAMSEGAAVNDIAAGFSYSVIKNCLFKVLKLKNISDLGKHIVVQGGTFKNHSIVRAMEQLTGCDVRFSDIPELMGAYGAALYAARTYMPGHEVTLESLTRHSSYQSSIENCNGCENHCTIKAFNFENGKTYYSGNNCEKVYSNIGTKAITKGINMIAEKRRLLFNPSKKPIDRDKAVMTIGLPRALGIYENYPFWYTLFTRCGISVQLSALSTNKLYNKGLSTIMADNICFPAKLMHGHIINLAEQKVDRIFYPYAVFEQKEDTTSKNSFNCPIVAGYSDVLKSSMDIAKRYGIPFDSPVVSFKDEALLEKSCVEYLLTLGIKKKTAKRAVFEAIKAQFNYKHELIQRNIDVLTQAETANRMVIMLAARPYHTDALIEHKVSQAISDMGIDIITEHIASESDTEVYNELNSVSQWAYPNRIFKAARFVGRHHYPNLHYVELTSFGCGPDAFILDEVNNILSRYHKNLTILKIDDVNNIGSLRLRIRSLAESAKIAPQNAQKEAKPFVTTKPYMESDKHRTFIAPYFAEGYSEFVPSLFKLIGYKLINLPTGSQEAADTGLKFANNEVCYPATIVIGSIINALKSGQYNPDDIAIISTQTGGQCRATNYLSLIKNAVVEAGFAQVPVVSLATGSSVGNAQPGFNPQWRKVLKITMYTMCYADCLSKLYSASIVREKVPGKAKQLREKYTVLAFHLIEANNHKGLMALLKEAVNAFNNCIDATKQAPLIGIVGEIYVKYNGYSNRFVVDWLNLQGIEVVAPSLADFFLTRFANAHIDKKLHIKERSMPLWLNDLIYRLIENLQHQFDNICADFPFYRKSVNIFQRAEDAKNIVNLAGDFGEGWLIPAEISGLAKSGVNNIISLQPFGCIANHIISKGIEVRAKQLFPQLNLLFLDFDSNTSEANVFNRLHFLINSTKTGK